MIVPSRRFAKSIDHFILVPLNFHLLLYDLHCDLFCLYCFVCEIRLNYVLSFDNEVKMISSNSYVHFKLIYKLTVPE